MKYFTPELYLRLQDFSSDEAMDRATEEWQKAGRRYRRYLKRAWDQLPEGLKALQRDFYLHDADVLSVGRQGATFLIVLRLDVPPRELLLLNYRLTRDAVVGPSAYAGCGNTAPVQWLYDEVEVIRGKRPCFRHSILLSNGWDLALHLSDVTILRADAVFPAPGTQLVPISA